MTKERILDNLKPMGLGLSLLFFGIPTIWFVICFYIFMPYLDKIGILPFYSYSLSMGFGVFALLIVSLVFYKSEKNPWKWQSFCERFRIKKMILKDWILLIIVFFISLAISMFLFPVFDKIIIEGGILPIPKFVPAWLSPIKNENSEELFDIACGGLKGNWNIIIIFIILLVLNVIGEEFWWRGYIFPRQELSFGKRTTIIHSILWAFFHLFKYWDIPGLVILHLPFSYMVYRTKNTVPAILWHFITNAVELIFLIRMVI
jgi:membrane protease YdiL (CAAX protease family)